MRALGVLMGRLWLVALLVCVVTVSRLLLLLLLLARNIGSAKAGWL